LNDQTSLTPCSIVQPIWMWTSTLLALAFQRGEDVARRILRQYWPLLALPILAVGIHPILTYFGRPWSPSEWASNIVFAYAIALATVLLSRRQSRLQESIADTELFGKYAAISGALDNLAKNCSASTAQQILIDARAGLHLLPYADEDSRREYLEALNDAAERLRDLVNGSTRPYTLWTRDQWSGISEQATSLYATLRIRGGKSERNSPSFTRLQAALLSVAQTVQAGNLIPFGPFERSYRYGDVSGRIRALLDWGLLQDYVDRGEASIEIYRHWAPRWLESHVAFSVWYITDEGEFATYTNPASRPISFREIDEIHDVLPRESMAAIESVSRWLEIRRDGVLPTTEIVTMEISPGRVLVLDGNHRLAAISRRRSSWPIPLQVNLVEYRIIAPDDVRLLPDLRFHYTEDGDRISNSDQRGFSARSDRVDLPVGDHMGGHADKLQDP
jgi:hypothetical protein